MLWQPGKQLNSGRYTLQKVLGVNHFTTTYLAKDRNDDDIIIKALNGYSFLELSPSERNAVEEKFKKVAEILAECRSRYIVATQKPFQEDGLWCVPMEYIKGTDLYTYTQGIMPEKEAINYIKQVGRGLSEFHIHEDRPLHRNINPANILIRSDKPEAVLIGFGLIRGTRPGLTNPNDRNSNFYPIELFSERAPHKPESDVYSLAATLYYLLTGQPPATAIDRVTSETRLIAPIELVSQISPHVSEAICKGMKINLNDRPSSIEKWLISLETPGNHSSFSASPPSTKKITAKKKIQVLTLIVTAIGAIGAFIGGVAGWIPLFKSSNNSSPTASPVSSPSPASSNVPPIKAR